MTGLKFAPLKQAVNKRLPNVLFYKTSGCKKAGCEKCVNGFYKAIETKTGKELGSFELSTANINSCRHGFLDYSELIKAIQSSNLYTGAGKEHRRVKLPYHKEYGTLYDVIAYQGKDLNAEQQWIFAHYSLNFLKNISDKFKHPIMLHNCLTPDSMKLHAIKTGEFVSIPNESYFRNYTFKQGRSISGKEMSDRCTYLTSCEGEDFVSGYNERTYKNVNKYLENNDSNTLVYAEYAVHPESKKPNLKTAIKEFFIRLTKY